MAEKLNIHVIVQNNQTVSQFLVHENGQVIFHNDASAKLKVEFSDAGALCKNGPKAFIEIDPGKKENLNVCNGTTMTSLKYTATIENTLPEDPILIIERSPINIFESNLYVTAGVGLLFGLVAGYLIARRLMTRNRPAS